MSNTVKQRHRSNQTSLLTNYQEATMTNQSTYQNMAMVGCETQSTSDLGTSVGKQYQPLGSASSDQQLTARAADPEEEQTHGGESVDQFGKFQSYVPEVQEREEEAGKGGRCDARGGGEACRRDGSDELGAENTNSQVNPSQIGLGFKISLNTSSDPSLMSKQTDLRSVGVGEKQECHPFQHGDKTHFMINNSSHNGSKDLEGGNSRAGGTVSSEIDPEFVKKSGIVFGEMEVNASQSYLNNNIQVQSGYAKRTAQQQLTFKHEGGSQGDWNREGSSARGGERRSGGASFGKLGEEESVPPREIHQGGKEFSYDNQNLQLSNSLKQSTVIQNLKSNYANGQKEVADALKKEANLSGGNLGAHKQVGQPQPGAEEGYVGGTTHPSASPHPKPFSASPQMPNFQIQNSMKQANFKGNQSEKMNLGTEGKEGGERKMNLSPYQNLQEQQVHVSQVIRENGGPAADAVAGNGRAGSTQTKQSYLNIYDELDEARKQHGGSYANNQDQYLYFNKQHNIYSNLGHRSEDQSTNSEATDPNCGMSAGAIGRNMSSNMKQRVVVMAGQKGSVATRNFKPANSSQTTATNQVYGKTNDTVRDALSGERRHLEVSSGYPQRIVSVESKNALQLLNNHSSKNFEEFQHYQNMQRASEDPTSNSLGGERPVTVVAGEEDLLSNTDLQMVVSKREPLHSSFSQRNFKLFGWGLNDQHQLGQLGMHPGSLDQSNIASPKSSKDPSQQLAPSSQKRGLSNEKAADGASMQNILFPRELKEFDYQVKDVVCGFAHSLIQTQAGQVFGLGENSHGQLGLPVSSNPILSQPTLSKINLPLDLIQNQARFDVEKVATSPGSDCHSLILLKESDTASSSYLCEKSTRQLLLGSGLNSHGQLGKRFEGREECEGATIVESFVGLDSINAIIKSNDEIGMRYTNIACGSRFSVVSVATYQNSNVSKTENENQQKIEELWLFGDLGMEYESHYYAQAEDPNFKQVVLPRCGLKDLKCSNDHVLALMNDGTTFVLDRSSSFEMRPLGFFPQKIVEIAASSTGFAALDHKNVIYKWSSDQSLLDSRMVHIEKVEYNNVQSTPHHLFMHLSMGNEFLHVLDEQGNLYGWGNNKHGELGTGDCFPRPYLSQIRVFNFRKVYLRCRNIYSGHSFSLGLFETSEDDQRQNSATSKQQTSYAAQHFGRSTKSAERTVNESSVISSLTRQLQASYDVINRSQALSKSAAFSGGALVSRKIQEAPQAQVACTSPGQTQASQIITPGVVAAQAQERQGQRDLEHDLVAHGDGPSPNTRLNMSKISDTMTPSGMPNLSNQQHFVSKFAGASPFNLQKKPPLNPTQSVNLSKSLSTMPPNYQPTQQNQLKNHSTSPATAHSAVAHTEQFTSQLNKTEEALQKYRRAASNYRENAYRMKVIEEMEGDKIQEKKGGVQEDKEDADCRRVSSYKQQNFSHGMYSKSLPRKTTALAQGINTCSNSKLTTLDVERQNMLQFNKYSPDLSSKNEEFLRHRGSVRPSTHRILAEGFKNSADFKNQNLSNVSREQLSKQKQIQMESTRDEACSNYKHILEIEKLGSGLVQHESFNIGSRVHSNYDFGQARSGYCHDHKMSVPETNNQKLTITSASNHEQQAAGSAYHHNPWKINNQDSFSKQSYDIDAVRQEEDGKDRQMAGHLQAYPQSQHHQRHTRQRSSISMTGPHIGPQTDDHYSEDHQMDQEKCVIQINANLMNQTLGQESSQQNESSFVERDGNASKLFSQQPMSTYQNAQVLRLESEPSLLNPLSQSYKGAVASGAAPDTTTNQSSKNNFGQTHINYAPDQSIGAKLMHANIMGYNTKQTAGQGAEQQMGGVKGQGSELESQYAPVMREGNTRPLRSKSLKPMVSVESSKITPDRSFRDEMPLQMTGSRFDQGQANKQLQSSNRQFSRPNPHTTSDPTSPDLNLGLAKIPSQIMVTNKTGAHVAQTPTHTSNTFKFVQLQQTHQSTSHNEQASLSNPSFMPTSHFKILTKDEWRQQMLKESKGKDCREFWKLGCMENYPLESIGPKFNELTQLSNPTSSHVQPAPTSTQSNPQNPPRLDRWTDNARQLASQFQPNRGRSHDVGGAWGAGGVRRRPGFNSLGGALDDPEKIAPGPLDAGVNHTYDNIGSMQQPSIENQGKLKQDTEGNQFLMQDSLEDTTTQQRLATGSFNGSKRLYSQLSADSQKRRRQEALKNLQERAQQMFTSGDSEQNVVEKLPPPAAPYIHSLENYKYSFEKKYGTVVEDNLQSTGGVLGGTFNKNGINNIVMVHSQSNMGSVMSTASLGHNSKESNIHGSNSGRGVGAHLNSHPRGNAALNPPTVTSIDFIDNPNNQNQINSSNNIASLQNVANDNLMNIDSRVSSMQNIGKPNIGSGVNSLNHNDGEYKKSSNQINRELLLKQQKTDNNSCDQGMDDIKVDLDAYKVNPYSPLTELSGNQVHQKPNQQIDSACDSRNNMENVVLDYSAATSHRGTEALKKVVKQHSRIQGHRIAHSTGDGQTNTVGCQESRTTLTVLSSISQSRYDLPDYHGQSTQSRRNTSLNKNLHIDMDKKTKHSSEHNLQQIMNSNDDNNHTNGTSSMQGISISHSTIDNIGIGGGETYHGQNNYAANSYQHHSNRLHSRPDSSRLNTNGVQQTHNGKNGQKVSKNRKSGTDEAKNKAFNSLQEKLSTCKQKLNKYKRKLKKYIAANGELQRDLELEKEQNKRLREQNDTLMQCDEQKEDVARVLQDQLASVEKQMMAMRTSYEQQIKQLSEENFSMLTDLQERDEKQRILQEKLEYVECEIESIGMQLKEQSEINQLLREQMALQTEQYNRQSDMHQQSQSQHQTSQKSNNYELEILSLRDENRKLIEQQKQMQNEYQDMQRRLREIEKQQEDRKLMQSSSSQQHQAGAFKSHEYLHAINHDSMAKINGPAQSSYQKIQNYQPDPNPKNKKQPVQLFDDAVKNNLQDKQRANLHKPNTMQTSPAAGIDGISVNLQNQYHNNMVGQSSRNHEQREKPRNHKGSVDYYAASGRDSFAARKSGSSISKGSRGSRRGERGKNNSSVSFQKMQQHPPSIHGTTNRDDEEQQFQSEQTRDVNHKKHLQSQNSKKQHEKLVNDSFSGHQHTFSQITQQSQLTAMTKEVQYNFRQDVASVGIERINIQSSSNMDEPDITDTSRVHSQRSSKYNIQPKSSRRSEDYQMGITRQFKQENKQQVEGDDSNLDIRVSREGVRSSSRMHNQFEIDQINQSSIRMADDSNAKIEQHLHEQISLEHDSENQNNCNDQYQMHQHQTFNRSNSIPIQNIQVNHGDQNEVSMAHLNNHLVRVTSTGGTERNDANERDQISQADPKLDNNILFNAYPRDGYPNFDYIQKRYLQKPQGNNQQQVDKKQESAQWNSQVNPKNQMNMPLMMTKSMQPTDQTNLTLNNDSASESEIEMLNKLQIINGQQVNSFMPQETNSSNSAFQSRLPKVRSSASRSTGGGRNKIKTSNSREYQSSRTNNPSSSQDKQSQSRIGKGIEKSYLEKFSQLSIHQQEQLISFINQNGQTSANKPLQTQKQPPQQLNPQIQRHPDLSQIPVAPPPDKYANIVQKIERIEQQANLRTLTHKFDERRTQNDLQQNQIPEGSALNSINNVPFSPTSQVAMSHVAMSQQNNGDANQNYEIDTRNFVGINCVGASSQQQLHEHQDNNQRGSRMKRPMSHLTDDSLEPANRNNFKEIEDAVSCNKYDDSSSMAIQEERFIDYKDAILNKFNKRTNNRLVQEQIVNERDHSRQSLKSNNENKLGGSKQDNQRKNSSRSYERRHNEDDKQKQQRQQQTADSKYSKSVEDMATIEHMAPPRITKNSMLESKSRSINIDRLQQKSQVSSISKDKPGGFGFKQQNNSTSLKQNNSKQLHSLDRLNQISGTKSNGSRFNNNQLLITRQRSKDSQGLNSSVMSSSNQDIAKKYKDAFKNLSQELKKKMNDVSQSKRQNVDEEEHGEGQLNGIQNSRGSIGILPSKSQDSFAENNQLYEHCFDRLNGNARHQQTNSIKHEKQLSLKYLQPTNSAIVEKNLNFHSNVSNESFGPSKSGAVSSFGLKAGTVAGTATDTGRLENGTSDAKNNLMKAQLGSLMRALNLDDSRPWQRTGDSVQKSESK